MAKTRRRDQVDSSSGGSQNGGHNSSHYNSSNTAPNKRLINDVAKLVRVFPVQCYILVVLCVILRILCVFYSLAKEWLCGLLIH